MVADTQLKPVADMVSGFRKALRGPFRLMAPADARGALAGIVATERARVVVALGKEAIDEALQLPPQVTVIYGLVILPVRTGRANTTGVYMATPVSEYISLITRHLPSLRHIASVSSPELSRFLGNGSSQLIHPYQAQSPFELVSTVKQLTDIDALLLLPDVQLLTTAAMEEIYLYSFRNKVPILGISEKQVKQGALLALVFDPVSLGRQLGEKAVDVLAGTGVGTQSAWPPRKFDLYLNSETARRMGLLFPDELLRRAKKDYR
jgi:ABC-type uncharacterized transport system substrate-binding protein